MGAGGRRRRGATREGGSAVREHAARDRRRECATRDGGSREAGGRAAARDSGAGALAAGDGDSRTADGAGVWCLVKHSSTEAAKQDLAGRGSRIEL